MKTEIEAEIRQQVLKWGEIIKRYCIGCFISNYLFIILGRSESDGEGGTCLLIHQRVTIICKFPPFNSQPLINLPKFPEDLNNFNPTLDPGQKVLHLKKQSVLANNWKNSCPN